MKGFLEKAAEAERLLEGRKRLVLYHRDTDGTTSAALLLKFFPSDAMPLESPALDPVAMYKIRQKKPDVLVFLDLAVDQEWEKIKELEKSMAVMVIDHHLFDRDLNSEKTLYINPRFDKTDIYVSGSYVVYHLLKRMGKDVGKHAWISGIGVIGDYAFEDGKDVLEDVSQADKSLVQGHPRESRLAEGAKLISSAITIAGDKGSEKSLRSLLQAEAFKDFQSDSQLRKWNLEVEKETGKVVDSFEKEREFHTELNLAIFTIKSKLPITSTIATIIAEKYPELVLIIKRQSDDGIKVSARNQSGAVNLNDLMRKAARGIGRGGGHERAAGAWVTDWETFRKRLLDELGKKKRN